MSSHLTGLWPDGGDPEDVEEKLDGTLEAVADDAQGEVEDLQNELDKVAEDVEAGNIAQALNRLQEVESRMAALELRLPEIEQKLEQMAPREHDHPLPSGMENLRDALAEIEEEEHPPERIHPLYRPIRGRS